MTKPEISGIAPFFIVRNVPAALRFYRDRLGFDITFQGPEPDDIFFGIVQRGAAMIIFKDVGVDPVPNYTRDIKKGIARWDAYLHVPDPDALASELSSIIVNSNDLHPSSRATRILFHFYRSAFCSRGAGFGPARHQAVSEKNDRLRVGGTLGSRMGT